MLFAILVGVAIAGFDVEVKNKTTVEFDIYKDYRPYIANEITIGRAGFVLEDPNGVVALNKNKITMGVKYSDTDWVMFDPHWYIQHSRDTKWVLEHGPEFRFDFRFW